MTTLGATIAERIRKVRAARFGEDIRSVSAAVGVPGATWRNYESGVSMPGEYLLKFIAAAAVHPAWLATGRGSMFQLDSDSPPS